jgi:hypothetical protein
MISPLLNTACLCRLSSRRYSCVRLILATQAKTLLAPFYIALIFLAKCRGCLDFVLQSTESHFADYVKGCTASDQVCKPNKNRRSFWFFFSSSDFTWFNYKVLSGVKHSGMGYPSTRAVSCLLHRTARIMWRCTIHLKLTPPADTDKSQLPQVQRKSRHHLANSCITMIYHRILQKV